jgi:hypothetical protein
MSAAEMWCRFCNWSGRPDVEHVRGIKVNVCPNCDWAIGLAPVSRRPADEPQPKQAYSAEARR